ncbi:MAG: hypothetical protein M9893_08970 [Pyrinomonadaceae bacterium]|nr:hypothetical protein [Pyrinomonadaceae bacterium]
MRWAKRSKESLLTNYGRRATDLSEKKNREKLRRSGPFWDRLQVRDIWISGARFEHLGRQLTAARHRQELSVGERM